MICFQDVSKKYGAVDALSGITFEVPDGAIYGYIGPNGAGKTTSLKILTGLIRSFSGEVTVSGLGLRANRHEVQGKIGYVPQDVGFQEWRTVEHALETFAELSGVAMSDRRRRIDSVLDLMGVQEHRKRRIVHLSGGTVQKIRIAQALLHDPAILIFDEPLSGLDPSSRFDVKNLLRRLREEGKTVLLSSHILSDIEDVADRIGILNEGKLLKEGTPGELREEFRIGTVFELETDGSDIAAADLDGVAHIERVEFVDATTIRLHVETGIDADSVSGEILRALLSSGRPVRAFAQIRPSLEDVYISLTGGHRNGD